MSKPLLLLFCLGTVLASAPAVARTSTSTNGGECPQGLVEETDTQGSAPAKPAARSGKAVPARAKNGSGALPRLGQPRWHSLLPGMFK